MLRLLTACLVSLCLSTVYGFFHDAVRQDPSHAANDAQQAPNRLLAQVKAMEESPLSRDMAAWARHVPGPPPEDLLRIHELVDSLRADPQAARHTWAEWKQKYAALCKERIDPHLPTELQCGQVH